MTTYRELYVHNTDGTGRVVAHARDDSAGRREIERQAFDLLARPDVEYATATVVERVAGFMGGRGRYR